MDGTVILRREIYKKDNIGQDVVEKIIDTEILCTISSITGSEWKNAGVNGINAACIIKTNAVNYSGEKTVIINGKTKIVYRTYLPPDSDEIELYVKDEAGA